MKRKRNPTCPKCGSTMHPTGKQWVCIKIGCRFAIERKVR